MRRVTGRTLLGGAALLGGCVQTATVESSAPPGTARIGTDAARDQLDALIAQECPRLLRAGKETGEGIVELTVDRSGAVQRSVLVRSSGDRTIDQDFSSVSALLKFDPPEGMSHDQETTRAKMGYSCSANAATVTINPF